jgi:hypothetical protein
MMSKKLTLILLFLGITSVVAAIYMQSGQVRAQSPATPAVQANESKIIAYYFHTTARCVTCRTIESYSREVIEKRFALDIARGSLQFKLVNLELPGNEHFVKDYQLFTKSLVLVRFEKGRQTEYKVLNDTWELVSNKQAMQAYVERELRVYLKRFS